MSQIRLRDLKLGKIDAKNELLDSSPEELSFFENSFLMPETVAIEDFTDNNVFFITGMKGTGKTALLRYLELEIKKNNPHCTTDFILFKTDITDEERNHFTSASNSFVAEKDSVDNREFTKYTGVWEWFFYRQILRISKEGAYPFFENDEHWKNFEECLNLPLESSDKGWFNKLGVKIKHGNVTVSAASPHLSATLGLDFEVNTVKQGISFSKLVNHTRLLFSKLTPTGYPLYLFIDELEVSMSNQKQYTRDMQLVRDLIIVIENFNRNCVKRKMPLRLIAGIRTEVLSAVETIGQEINKIISDFGRPLNWQYAGNDYQNHPLMKLLTKRIKASEAALNIPVSSEDEIWIKYFPTHINTNHVQKYLLQMTWERPRDIIRLLDISKKLFGNESTFSQKVFEGIAKEYSKESWIEITEELAAIYKPNEIKGIKDLLTGMQCPFTYKEAKEESEQKMDYSEDLAQLLKKHKLADILRSLYNVGIIGNAGKRVRFSFRGDDGLLLNQDMKIVDPLWKHLSISRRQSQE